MRYRDVSIRKITAVRHLGFLKLNFNSRAVQKHFVRHRARFYGGRSYSCRYIAIVGFFLVKCKNSLGDRA